jgi:hypothetical protein
MYSYQSGNHPNSIQRWFWGISGMTLIHLRNDPNTSPGCIHINRWIFLIQLRDGLGHFRDYPNSNTGFASQSLRKAVCNGFVCCKATAIKKEVRCRINSNKRTSFISTLVSAVHFFVHQSSSKNETSTQIQSRPNMV